MEELRGRTVAILVEDGFERVELVEPRKALDRAGAKTQIVSPRSKQVRAWSQVALQFLLRQPGLFAIPKASTPEHTAENAGAADFQLSIADVKRIDGAFPRGARPDRLPTL